MVQGQEIGNGIGIDRAVVVLIHGIRDRAGWQRMVKDILEIEDTVEVVPIGYGYFDIFRFLLPGPTRRRPIEVTERKLRTAMAQAAPGERVSVIAHSYGTYTITRLLAEHRDIELEHLILCGAIVPHDFDWGAARRQIRGKIINDYGVRDHWPAVAQAATWGFGDTGTYGIKMPGISDRDHDCDHSGFMVPDFVRDYWHSFFVLGEERPPARPNGKYPSTPRWFGLIGMPWKSVVLVLLIACLVWLDLSREDPWLSSAWDRLLVFVGARSGIEVSVPDAAEVIPPSEEALTVGCDTSLPIVPVADLKDALESSRGVQTDRWLKVAIGELGVQESPGDETNPRILEYNSASRLSFADDETPWNSQFINWVFAQVGEAGTYDGRSRSWLLWGQDGDVGDPLIGSVVVASRPGGGDWGGVAGFYVGDDPDRPDAIQMLAGNICNAVNVVSVALDRVLGYRVPSDWVGPAQ